MNFFLDLTNFFSYIVGMIGMIQMTIASGVAIIGGFALNLSIKLTLEIGGLINSIGSVNVVWSVIRDFTGIFFIFILLYVSIMTIIGHGDKNSVKKLVLNIVLAGLFINFSMFITKTIIDGSNILALGFYNAITKQASKVDSFGAKIDGGLSDILMNGMAIQKSYNIYSYSSSNPSGASAGDSVKVATNPITLFVKMSFTSILLIIGGIIFLAGAVLFFIRTLQLIIYIAVSPLFAFKFINIPILSSKISESSGLIGFDKFISQALFAPTFLAVLYIALKVIEPGETGSTSPIGTFIDTFTKGNPELSQMSAGWIGSTFTGTIGSTIQALIFMALAATALSVAKKASFAGGDKIIKWAEQGTDWAKSRLSPVAQLQRAGREAAMLKVFKGKSAYDLANDRIKSTIDSASRVGAAGKLFGLDRVQRSLGEKMKSGIESTSVGQTVKSRADIDTKINRTKIELERKSDYEGAIKKMKEFENTPDSKDYKDAYQKYVDIMGKMSGSEIESNIKLKSIIGGKDGKPNYTLAATLPDSYFKAVEAKVKEGKVSEDDYRALKNARYAGFAEHFKDGSKRPQNEIIRSFSRMDGEEIVSMYRSTNEKGDKVGKDAVLSKFGIGQLTESKLKQMMDRLDPEERKEIATKILEATENQKRHPEEGWNAAGFDFIRKNNIAWGISHDQITIMRGVQRGVAPPRI